MSLVKENSATDDNKSAANPLSRSVTNIAILAGPNKGQYFEMPTTGVVTLGRGSDTSVQILDKGISRCHANLFFKEGKVHIEDLHSTNGTYINKKKHTDQVELKHGDKIFIGSSTLLMVVEKEGFNTDLTENDAQELTRDPLTNLLDNQSCLKCLKQTYRDSKHTDTPFCMLMIKIDDFDQVKDSFGTMGGDQIFIQIAEILTQLSRPQDYVCHFSKEVFLIICPDSDTFTGIEFAEKIRATIEDSAFLYKTYQIRVTASIGISNYPENGMQSETQIVEFAHNAMHHAEKSGKNSASMA